MADQAASSSPNPYLTVVAKKSRNLHKKLDKIVKADLQQQSGKALNEEQLVLLTTRSSVEKQIADIDGIKALLEEVAAAESPSPDEIASKKSADDAREKEVSELKALVANSAAEVTSCKHEIEQLKHQLSEQETDRVNSERVLLEMQMSLEAAKATAASKPSTSTLTSELQASLQGKINKLLKLFHICARYPGDRLPADVNFFGKCLMGETSISGFKETLQECTRKAELYLDDDLCGQFEASRGMTYLDISHLMDDLAAELGGPPTPPPEPTSPMINFFTDTSEPFTEEPLSLNSTPLDMDIIDQHINAVIDEAKTSLAAESDTAQKKKQTRPKKPRTKKENKPKDTTGGDQTTTAASTQPSASKPVWGGEVSQAHKESAPKTTPASGTTPAAGKGTRNNKGGAGRGNGGNKGPRSGKGAKPAASSDK
mmetsp:Transcript_23812/g.40540  ORF Transcript_23812/g.40540 Transcript_23812/m.40540 type:complete len:428 (+) Transcript_23812:36-1319(+)